jgi:DNA-3-methyladenine glycosylase
MSRLNKAFFERDTVEVAQDLLGRILVRTLDGKRLAGRIVETEAYSGFDDAASHAYGRMTPRSAVMFGEAGISYMYFIYGKYWMLNVIAKPRGVDYPAAILIRAVEPVEGLEIMAVRRIGRAMREWTNGPARLVDRYDRTRQPAAF